MEIKKQKQLKDQYPILFTFLPTALLEDRETTFNELLEAGQREPISFGIECLDGWFDIINEASAKLEELNQTLEIKVHAVQIKEKFGTLRFYIDNYIDAADEITRLAEDKSEVTCEVCGKPGKLYSEGWWTTVCDEHRK